MKLVDLLKVLSGTYELKTKNKELKEIDINIKNVMEYIDKEIEEINVYIFDKTTIIKLSFKEQERIRCI